MGKVIVLISSKGGSGKSTVAVGLASAFSSLSKSVLLIDADEGARCLDTMLGVSEDTCFDLGDVLSGRCEPGDAAINAPALEGVKVIPSPFSPGQTDFSALSKVAASAAESYDYVIIDTKGQLPAERLALLPHDAFFISVVTPDDIAVRNTGLLSAGLWRAGIKCRLIIDRFTLKRPDGKCSCIDNIIDCSAARLLGIIPEDKYLSRLNSGECRSGKAAQAMYRIAARIDGNDIPLPKIKNVI